MTEVIESTEVDAPLDTVVHQWSKCQRMGRQLPEAFATFQGLPDEHTRVKLCAEQQQGSSASAQELGLEEELDRFKHVVEADVADRSGLLDWLSQTVWHR
ncbi:hypothetical protein [Lentzea sp. NEAU-D7]|uniref:hypothetical protein n=1 Tax=Lentzea sp. NEAU-D7 TaxID=2994667 RepID=UPI00224AF23B|nr:hypothetical protein [Lentzea sp. NEAU-D7]MCX2948874.1 hypothetical protein [Lentzea sp. NEAU-D7]